jgi:hypothetical protein
METRLPGSTNSPYFSIATLHNGDVVTCELTSNSGCVTNHQVISNAIAILVNAAPIAIVNNDTTICAGSTVELAGGGGAVCHWNAAPGLSAADTTNCAPIVAPTTTVTYTLIITDNNNCNASADVTVFGSSLSGIKYIAG